MCFPANFAKFLRTLFLAGHIWTIASEKQGLQVRTTFSLEHDLLCFPQISYFLCSSCYMKLLSYDYVIIFKTHKKY